MRRTLLVVSLLLVIAIPFSAYVLATVDDVQPYSNPEDPSDLTSFTTMVNGVRSVDVDVLVDLNDGVTTEEAEVIAEVTFTTVMGPNRVHQVETLTLEDAQLIAECAWGYDENDLGHVFHMTVDLTTRQITVSHCF